LVWVIIQNKIWMVYPVSCTAVCYVTVITLFIKNVRVVHPIFFGGGSGPTQPPVVAPVHGTKKQIQIRLLLTIVRVCKVYVLTYLYLLTDAQ